MNLGESTARLVELEFKKRDVEKSVAYYSGWPIGGLAAGRYRRELEEIEREIAQLKMDMHVQQVETAEIPMDSNCGCCCNMDIPKRQAT